MANLAKKDALLASILLLFPIGTPSLSQEQKQTQTQTQDQNNLKLSATLTVDANAAAIDPVLLPGNEFDKNVAQALLRNKDKSTDNWRKIPMWLQGEWETKQTKVTKAVQYINGKSVPLENAPREFTSKRKYGLGKIRDKNGDVWDQYSSDYWTTSDKGDDTKTYTYFVLTSEGEGSYPDGYAENVAFRVDSTSNKILSVLRGRAWARYSNIEPGIVKEYQVATELDDKGHPRVTSWCEATSQRVRTFESYENSIVNLAQLQASFLSYCRVQGYENLLEKP